MQEAARSTVAVARRGKQGAHRRAVCRARSLRDEEGGEQDAMNRRLFSLARNKLFPASSSSCLSGPGADAFFHFRTTFLPAGSDSRYNLPTRVQALTH